MPDYAIETENLTKVFTTRWPRRSLTAVDNISLRVPTGSTYGLLGPNGAGKTTFVKMLLSAAHPTSGRAIVFGRDSREPEARAPIGYLPENHRFPTYLTGWDMLDFYGALSGMNSSERRRRIPDLLAQVGLDERAHSLRLGKYSKGMLQRVGLAQALMHAPRLLVLDEPSDGVDPVGRKQIREVLHALEQQGVTIFLNSHLLAEVELFCREVAIIQKGKLALSGTVLELTSGSGYRLELAGTPEMLETELRSRARTTTAVNGTLNLIFSTREEANQALDLVRANKCQVETFGRTHSTLEEVFMKTVEANEDEADTHRGSDPGHVPRGLRTTHFLGFAGCCTALLLFLMFIMRIDVVAGALATVSIFGRAMPTTDVQGLVQQTQSVIAMAMYFFGMALAVFASAGLVAAVFEPGRIELLLSKPVSRTRLLLGRYAGNVLVVAANILYLTLGSWIIFGIKTGVWGAGYLLSSVFTIFVFSVLLAVIVLLGVLWESAAVAIMATFGIIIGTLILAQRTSIERLLDSEMSRDVVRVLYYILPKTSDISVIIRHLILNEPVDSWMPVWSTALFGVVVLGAGILHFRRKSF